ncbi:hypothetical protein PGDDIFCJ_00036 [Thermus phage YS40_Isch]|nr:hypothetical protein PGDDIFCJ_00036 [Thermus phage YS40_Isch]
MPVTIGNTITQFTIDFSSCNCESNSSGSELFEVSFEQNKKGILAKIKNLTSSTLKLVIESYITSKKKYSIKNTVVQGNGESFVFFPVEGVDDVVFAIYEESDNCTLVFDEQKKEIIFSTTNADVIGLCLFIYENITYKRLLKIKNPQISTVTLSIHSLPDFFNAFNLDMHCFCVKKNL